MNFDFLSAVTAFGGGALGYIVPFLFVLTIVVFFHELGHFLIGRLAGVRVLTFSIGFGPELFGFNDRHGTRWKISAVPLGGYVKFFGDENEASVPDRAAAARMSEPERRESFVHQKVGPRAAIVAAGPIANFLLAIVIFAGLFMVYGKQITAARVEAIVPSSAAATAGFQPGDVILSINGRAIESFSDMQRIVTTSAGETLQVVVDRKGTQVTLTAVPELKEQTDRFGNVHRIGLLGIQGPQGRDIRNEPVSPIKAVTLGVQETWFIIDRTMSYLGGILSGREAADQLGGPIRIAEVSGQVATVGLDALLHLAAVLSVSIGLLNLFPVPMLDGGHLMFYLIEAVRGRPLSDRAQEYGFRVGLALVLMLMIFATYNDILHIAAKFTAS
jgi:regulator of sigma E protease